MTDKKRLDESTVYKIGRLGKPHGVKGEVTFQFDDDVFVRTEADYLVLEIDGILVPFFIEEYRFHGEATALVKFCDVDTQEQARELTGCTVFFPRQQTDGEDADVSWSELIGFTLVDAQSNRSVGKVVSVDDSTLNVLFDVRTADERDVLVPASEELIEDIDIASQEIRMNLPEGILEI